MFEVDAVKYVPSYSSVRACDVIDYSYYGDVKKIEIGNSVVYGNVTMKNSNVAPYTFYENKDVESLDIY